MCKFSLYVMSSSASIKFPRFSASVRAGSEACIYPDEAFRADEKVVAWKRERKKAQRLEREKTVVDLISEMTVNSSKPKKQKVGLGLHVDAKGLCFPSRC